MGGYVLLAVEKFISCRDISGFDENDTRGDI